MFIFLVQPLEGAIVMLQRCSHDILSTLHRLISDMVAHVRNRKIVIKYYKKCDSRSVMVFSIVTRTLSDTATLVLMLKKKENHTHCPSSLGLVTLICMGESRDHDQVY